MEEDIKILEEWLIQLNELFEKTKINNTKERKSLKNLIKGYKEVEKDLHEMTISNNHKKELENRKKVKIQMYEVTYSMNGIIKKISVNANDPLTAIDIFTNMFGGGAIEIINIVRK